MRRLSVSDFLDKWITDDDKHRLNNPPSPLHLPVHKLIAPSKLNAAKPLKIYQIYRRNFVAGHKDRKLSYHVLNSQASQLWFDESSAIRGYFIFLQQLMRRHLDIVNHRN
ncbi:3332_t:CDS:1, partial [Paraglomus occultum]